MTNPWIEHVKAFASKKGISYFDALKHKDVKKGYKTKSGGAPGRNPFAFGDTKIPSPPAATEGFTMGTQYPNASQSRRVVKPKVAVRSPPVPAPAPAIPTMEINSLSEFEKFLDKNKYAIGEVLRKDYTKKQFLLKFHPDKCITSSKSVEDLMMKVLGKKVIVNAPPVKICEAIFKLFI